MTNDGNQHRTDDAIRAYLQTIGSIPLLTAEQERHLAEQITVGRGAATRLAEPLPPTPDERAALAAAVAAGTAAREQIITANLRLVVHIARNYLGNDLTLMDLIQEGNLGLMRAVEKFDPARGTRFSTYATQWVRQAISRSVADQSRTIRLPVHTHHDLVRMRRVAQDFQRNRERMPTKDELAAELGWGRNKLRRMLTAVLGTVSLDHPLRANDTRELGHLVPDPQPSPEEIGIHRLLRADLEDALAGLEPREQCILRLRFGLDDGVRWTLEEVSAVIGVTRERTRQIEAKVLHQLRQVVVLQEYREAQGVRSRGQ